MIKKSAQIKYDELGQKRVVVDVPIDRNDGSSKKKKVEGALVIPWQCLAYDKCVPKCYTG